MTQNKSLSAVLLITGTSIGAGMLALPVTTAPAGWWGAVVLLLACWFVMYLAGLLVIETSLWLPVGTHFLSMTRRTLGPAGELFALISFLALLYSLMAAYLVGGSSLLHDAISMISPLSLSNWVGPMLWVVIAALVVGFGIQWVDIINRLLVMGLVIGYVLLTVSAMPHVHFNQLPSGHFSHLLLALPVVITAFGYHVVIPSIRNHLTDHPNKIVKVLLVGTLIPLMVYLLWEYIILAMLPLQGANGLLSILKSGDPAATLSNTIAKMVHSPWVSVGTRLFVFFALTSSYLGIAFALFDFIYDGLKMRAIPGRRPLALLLAFVPPLLYAIYFSHGFIIALSYAGIFVAILHGIIPVMMVYAGRKKFKHAAYTTPGGIFALGLVMVFSVIVIVCDLLGST